MLSISKILDELHLKEDMVAAEFGCGTANIAVQLARHVSKGKVYALDIQEEKISALKGRLRQRHITNVIPILCDVEADKGSTLFDSYLDAVLIPNVLFQSENRPAIIKEAHRILKPGGQMMVVDWLKKAHAGHGEHLAIPGEVKKMAAEAGFMLKKEFNPGDYHYALLFVK